MGPRDKFKWSNKLRYGSHILRKKRPIAESYPPGNQDKSAYTTSKIVYKYAISFTKLTKR